MNGLYDLLAGFTIGFVLGLVILFVVIGQSPYEEIPCYLSDGLEYCGLTK